MAYSIFEIDRLGDHDIVTIQSSDLHTWWKEHLQGVTVVDDLVGERVFQEAFLEYSGHGKREDKLAFFRGGWTINLKAGLAKTVLVGASLCGIFSQMQGIQIASTVLPTLLPFLFEINRVELSAKEEYILAKLLVKNSVKKHLHSADELYDKLPKDVRKMINRLDFIDFLEKLDMAGHIRRKKAGEYQLSGKRRFRVTFL
ncbi:MAG: hypothetical protein H6569_15690 [Lewinellaceae bacterium]|nr:hypothetical protein [Lewinellaceae bacterium]